MSAKHTPGPWYWSDDYQARDLSDTWSLLGAGGYGILSCDGKPNSPQEVNCADARLIAAAPDYHDAAFWIRQAIANNAAPVNPLAALEEMAIDGEHVTLDAGLVLDLLKAHAKATGGAA